MTYQTIQPWGTAPTRLLPSILVEHLGELPAPEWIQDRLNLLTLKDVELHLWDRVDSVPLECLRQMVRIIEPHLLELSDLPIRSDQPLAVPIEDLPFSTFIANRVLRHLDILDVEVLFLGDILGVRTFGPRATLEFACVLEMAIVDDQKLNSMHSPNQHGTIPAQLKNIQPWGTSPTPLVPSRLLTLLGHLPVPVSLGQSLGVDCMSDLIPLVWARMKRVPVKSLSEIVQILGPDLLRLKQVVVRSGRYPAIPLIALPLGDWSRRYWWRLSELLSSEIVTVGSLGQAVGWNIGFILEFWCVVEAAETVVVGRKDDEFQTAHRFPPQVEAWLQHVSAYAWGELNCPTLAEVLPEPPSSWPEEITELWKAIGSMGSGKFAGELIHQYSVFELVMQLLEGLDPRARVLAQERIFVTDRPKTLQDLGEELGITRERVRQLEVETKNAFNRVRSNRDGPVVRRARKIREKLGNCLPADHVLLHETLRWATEDFDLTLGTPSSPWQAMHETLQDSDNALNSNEYHTGVGSRVDYDADISLTRELVASFLLWLAGPYRNLDGWLIVREQDWKNPTVSAVRNFEDHRGFISDENVAQALNDLDIKGQFHEAWIDHIDKFRRMEEGWIYFRGSILDKAFALLRYFEIPMTPKTLLEYVGSSSEHGLRARMHGDPRFWRVNVQSEFVIAGTAGYDEYTGIVNELLQELKAQGGIATTEHLVNHLTRMYGVKATSVHAYLQTKIFETDRTGRVWTRDPQQSVDVDTNIQNAAACYQQPDGTWLWRVEVDRNLERGSGRTIPNAFCAHLGCRFGEKQTIESEYGNLNLSWSISSLSGATISSLRNAVMALKVHQDDSIFVQATHPQVTFRVLRQTQIRQAQSDLAKLGMLLGGSNLENDSQILEFIGCALNIAEADPSKIPLQAYQRLEARRESALAALIQPTGKT